MTKFSGNGGSEWPPSRWGKGEQCAYVVTATRLTLEGSGIYRRSRAEWSSWRHRRNTVGTERASCAGGCYGEELVHTPTPCGETNCHRRRPLAETDINVKCRRSLADTRQRDRNELPDCHAPTLTGSRCGYRGQDCRDCRHDCRLSCKNTKISA